MRTTKAMLETRIKLLEFRNEQLERDINLVQRSNRFLEGIAKGPATMIIALEKTTEAVAYVLSDLKRR